MFCYYEVAGMDEATLFAHLDSIVYTLVNVCGPIWVTFLVWIQNGKNAAIKMKLTCQFVKASDCNNRNWCLVS